MLFYGYTNAWGKFEMDKIVTNLLILKAVIELKNFSLAAEYLNVSQSTVSRRIEELEAELGVELVRRNTREIEIKPIAIELCRQFIIDARYVLMTINKLQLSANHLSGRITAIFPQTFGNIYIAPYLYEFNRQYPNIELIISYYHCSLDNVVEPFDIGVFNQPVESETLKSQLLLSITGGLYCTKNYADNYEIPVTIDELKNHLVVGITEFSQKNETEIMPIMDANGDIAGKLVLSNLNMITNGSLFSLAVASSNHAIACIWGGLVARHFLQRDLVQVLPEYSFGRTNYYLTMTRNTLLPVQKVFLDFIKQKLTIGE